MDLVALDRGVDDLRNAALVREAHDEPVLRRVVLVLLLADLIGIVNVVSMLTILLRAQKMVRVSSWVGGP